MMTGDVGDLLLKLFGTAVQAAQPELCLPKFLPDRPNGKIVVIGAGKAAAAMAAVVEEYYGASISGLVITQYGYAVDCRTIEIVEASHPIPDIAGQKATKRILGKVNDLSNNDLVLCLISGGGSALLTLPSKGLSLEEKQSVNERLIRCGAKVNEINVVRKHLSQVKGGRLAEACWPASLVTLVISDVVGDDLSVIASGPTVPDPSTCADALAVIQKFGLKFPPPVRKILESSIGESPKPGDKIFNNNIVKTIANGRDALTAAAKVAEEAGYTPIILGDDVEGEARDMGKEMAEVIMSNKHRAPCVLLSGGELTVSVKGSGKGGPNTEFLLSLAIELEGVEGVFAIACDTDGVDGCGNSAGAVIGPDTLIKAEALGLDAKEALSRNNTSNFFRLLDDLVISGPTYTNVNDFRAIVISSF